MDLNELTKDQLKTDLPAFAPGDTLRVHTRIKEGDKERIQVFEGVVLRKTKGDGIRGNFTVRRIASGVGVERTFLLHSPNIQKIEVTRHGKVRRSRLYYLRDLKSKTIKIKQKGQMEKKKKASKIAAAESVSPAEAPEESKQTKKKASKDE